jgi:hypothetical protein
MSRFARLVNAQQQGEAKQTGPVSEENLTNTDGLSNMDRLSNVDSLSCGGGGGCPVDRLSTLDSLSILDNQPTEDSSDVLSVIPPVAGHTTLPHAYTDHLARWLSPDEQAVYVQLYRLSWGWGKDTCFISNRRLSERSGMPETSMRRAVRKLIAKRLIEKTDRVFGSNAEQGIEYRVSTLDRLSNVDRVSNVDSLSNVAPNKEKNIKENIKRGVDASRCPDCMGTGFYYPEGNAKGVKRCEHKKLR